MSEENSNIPSNATPLPADVRSPSTASPISESLVIPLTRPKMWTGGLVAATIVITMISISTGYELFSHYAPSIHSWKDLTADGLAEVFAGWGLLIGILVLVIGKRLITRLKPMPSLVLGEQALTLPVHAESWRVHRLPYAQILSIAVTGRPNPSHLQIETAKRLYHIPLLSLGQMSVVTNALDALRLRIMSQPNGAAHLETMQQQRLAADALLQRRPTVMHVLLGVEAVFFANQYFTDTLRTPLGPIGWGANSPVLVQAGQYFRVLSANFLHGSVPELMLAMLGIFYLGTVIERIAGHARTIVIVGVSALAASMTTAIWAPGITYMGAWGGVYGLAGAQLVLNIKRHSQLPPGFRQPLSFWVRVAALSIMLVLFFDTIAWQALLVGGMLGAALMALFLNDTHTNIPLPISHTAIRQLSILTIGIYVLGLVAAVQYAANFDVEREYAAAEKLVHADRTNAEDLNMLAWLWSVEPKTPTKILQLAEDAATRAISEDPQPEHSDTLANVHYRLGEYSKAVTLEQQVLREKPDHTFYAMQLARFIIAQHIMGQQTNSDTITLDTAPGGSATLHVTMGNAPDAPQHIYAVATRSVQSDLVHATASQGEPRTAPAPARVEDHPSPLLLVRINVDPSTPHQLSHSFDAKPLLLWADLDAAAASPSTTQSESQPDAPNTMPKLTWFVVRIPVTQAEQLAAPTPNTEAQWRTWIMSGLLTQMMP